MNRVSVDTLGVSAEKIGAHKETDLEIACREIAGTDVALGAIEGSRPIHLRGWRRLLLITRAFSHCS